MEVHLKANGNIFDIHHIGFHLSLNHVSGQQTLFFFASFLWNLISCALYMHHKHIRMNLWLDLCLSSGIWWVFRVWEPVALSGQRRSTCVLGERRENVAVLQTKGYGRVSVTTEMLRLWPRWRDKEWTKQAYVQVCISFTSWTNSEWASFSAVSGTVENRVLPWRLRVEIWGERGKEGMKNRLIEEIGTTDPSCWCSYTTGQIHPHSQPISCFGCMFSVGFTAPRDYMKFYWSP